MFKAEAFDDKGKPIVIVGVTPEDLKDLLERGGLYIWDFADLQHTPTKLLLFAEETEEAIVQRLSKYDPKGPAH